VHSVEQSAALINGPLRGAWFLHLWLRRSAGVWRSSGGEESD